MGLENNLAVSNYAVGLHVSEDGDLMVSRPVYKVGDEVRRSSNIPAVLTLGEREVRVDGADYNCGK